MIIPPKKSRRARARRSLMLGRGLERLEQRTVLSTGNYTGALLIGLGSASKADVAAQAERLGATLAEVLAYWVLRIEQDRTAAHRLTTGA